HLKGAVLDEQLAYWKETLAGAPVLALPTDHARTTAQRYRGAAENLVLSRTLADKLEALGREEGATLFMVCLAAYKVLLSRYAGQQDVVVGTPIANRGRGEVEHLIGF